MRVKRRKRDGHDLDLLVTPRVLDVDAEHEPVELGLGQRIGPLVFDGILGGDHEKGPRQLARLAPGGHRVFLHRLEQRGLRLGRRAVDLVGQDQVGEDGAMDEVQPPLAGTGVGLQDFGPGHVRGHQVGRELDALEIPPQRLGQRPDQQRLGQPRHPDDQCVPLREQHRQELPDQALLTDDDLVQFPAQNAPSRGVNASQAARNASGARASAASTFGACIVSPFKSNSPVPSRAEAPTSPRRLCPGWPGLQAIRRA